MVANITGVDHDCLIGTTQLPMCAGHVIGFVVEAGEELQRYDSGTQMATLFYSRSRECAYIFVFRII